RVKGVPYVASEWQTSAPNDYRHEGPLVMAAYAALGNFNSLEFAFSHDRAKHSDQITQLSHNFDIVEQPTMLGAWPAVSLLFHRHDVAESKQEAVLKIDQASVFLPGYHGGLPKELARLGRTGISFSQGQTLEQLELLSKQQIKDGVARANDGELVHDAKRGTLLVDTARTQAFAGFKPSQPIKLGNVELELSSAFAVVIVTALDDQPLAGSKRILVSALGNAVNSGMSLTPGRNQLKSPGSAPVLVEPIVGRLGLVAVSKARSTVYALGPNGERDHPVPTEDGEAGARFRLSAEHRTMHYEIVRE
ncbi:MAG TPA: hypothetical protein VEQ59_24115, partial [Polyangiaceae bacterium]|nr:hypothetical protein [Polyangiaceae bacterium]